MKRILTLLLFMPLLAHSISEENFEEVWKGKVLPFYKKLNHRYFYNKKDLRLHFASFKATESKRTIVILPGQSEPAMKYAELAYDLSETGSDLYIIDHQGQGESQRLLKDSQKGHVTNFEDYVRDFSQLMEEFVIPERRGPIYFIAHSMGGAIATFYMDENPWVVERATLVAPMFEINTAPYPSKIAYLYSKFLNATGKGQDYAPGRGPYDINARFESNLLTHSKVRFEAGKFLFSKWPDLVIGGPTVRWVYTSLKKTRSTGRILLSTPVLLFQAGKDKIVRGGKQNSFCQKNACTRVVYPEAKHEILMEKDVIRNESLRRIRSFFNL